MDFAHVYCSNHFDDVVRDEIKIMNKEGDINTSIWSASEFMDAIKKYLKNNMHFEAKKIMENIRLAEAALNVNEKEYYEIAALTIMLKASAAREYMDTLYEKALRTNFDAMEKYMEDSKHYGEECLMYRKFFDMYLGQVAARLTEYVDFTINREVQRPCEITFRADNVDKFLEIANVGVSDTYTLGQLNDGDPYLTLLVYKADGSTEKHTLIPVKWIRSAAATNSYVKSLVPEEEVNKYYRAELWE